MGNIIAYTISWMIGNGLTDIKAGKDAGAKTILLGKVKCELYHLMTEGDAKPDVIVSNLKEATEFILNKEAKCGNLHRLSKHH
jgi:phosphoglycolate phosphatase-like HAD superfamily hydrolase